MNQIYLNKLEYNKIIENLATYCQTYFGKEPERYEYTVDGGHPNDLGMKAMAYVIAPVIKKILENGGTYE